MTDAGLRLVEVNSLSSTQSVESYIIVTHIDLFSVLLAYTLDIDYLQDDRLSLGFTT